MNKIKTNKSNLNAKKVAFAVIIVHFKGISDTLNCIKSLLQIDYGGINIILIDNSEDIKDEFILSHHFINTTSKVFELDSNKKNVESVFLIENDCNIEIVKIKTSNRGFAAANNVGLSALKDLELSPDWIWLLNNDTEVAPDVLTKINVYLQSKSNEKLGIVGNDIFLFENKTILQGIGGTMDWLSFSGKDLVPAKYNLNECNKLFEKSADYVIGASMFVNVHFVEDVGKMNEDYFLYYEEIDWILRGKLKNWKIGYCFGAKVYHKIGASIGSGNSTKNKSDLSDFYGIRSKIIFVKYFYPLRMPILFFSLFLSFCKRIYYGYYKRGFRILKMLYKEVFVNQHSYYK